MDSFKAYFANTVSGSGGGGGFSPTPWEAEFAFVNLAADANDGGLVAPAGAPIYDPLKEYLIGSLSITGASGFVAPGDLTLSNFIAGAYVATGVGGAAVGSIEDTVNGTVNLQTSGAQTVLAMMVPSGGILGGAAAFGPTVAAANFGVGEGLGFQLSDGAFVKDWDGNAGGADMYYFVISRQVIAAP